MSLLRGLGRTHNSYQKKSIEDMQCLISPDTKKIWKRKQQTATKNAKIKNAYVKVHYNTKKQLPLNTINEKTPGVTGMRQAELPSSHSIHCDTRTRREGQGFVVVRCGHTKKLDQYKSSVNELLISAQWRRDRGQLIASRTHNPLCQKKCHTDHEVPLIRSRYILERTVPAQLCDACTCGCISDRILSTAVLVALTHTHTHIQ